MIGTRPRIGVVTFPGSNDDRDAAWALGALGAEPVPIWHAEPELPDVQGVLLPGGFSYGDYLRCGAIARLAPAMSAVSAFAADGGPVLGICNGFQILCEAGLVPGVLRPNESDSFGRSTPGRRPASQRIWNPLQIPTTGPPARANSATASITGEKRAMAPVRR